MCACGSISEQLSSPTHIVVECTTSVHKVLYEPTEWGAKLLVGLSAMHVIQPVEETQHRIQEIFFYKYSRVKYGPIKAEDALVRGIKLALDELHECKISHNDVRLPNVCYNDKYEPVLIDVDRCHVIEEHHQYFGNASSCMYLSNSSFGEPVGKYTDHAQLGWMVAWIVDSSMDEHSRQWEEQSTQIQENQFISELVRAGTYNLTSLESSFPDDSCTIQSLLCPA